MKDFVHLHLHTEFSLLDGACRIDELLDQAQQLKMPALAVTEHGNMFSAVVFHDAARKRGINPILGCEVYVAPGDRRDKSGTPGETANHLVLLAENEKGFKNLIKLVSSGYTEGFYYKPRIDKQLLAQHSRRADRPEQLPQGRSRVARSAPSRRKKAIAAAAQYRDILGEGNFFLEMQFQGIDEQRIVNNGLLPIAQGSEHAARRAPTTCTTCGTAITSRTTSCCASAPASRSTTRNRLKYHGDQFFLKTAAEMARGLRRLPGGDAEHAADRRALQRRRSRRARTICRTSRCPKASRSTTTSSTSRARATRSAWSGCASSTPKGSCGTPLAQYDERLAYEIAMIKQMGIPGYFMIVWDFIRYAREQGIPVGPGRGSAAGSLAAWALRITDVDPLYYDLIFERFLNPERVSLPDIDVDFCERRRGEVIDYVTREVRPRERLADHHLRHDEGQGRDSRRRPRHGHAVRGCRSHRQADSAGARHDARQGARREPGAARDGEDRLARQRRARDGQAPRRACRATPASTPPAWSSRPGPISDYAPLFKSNRDEITTQWAMKEVERVGLLKMDFLGLSTLTLIQDALAEIKRTEGIVLDIDTIPLDDAKTYQLFVDGQTYGIFQFESSGMREILRAPSRSASKT